MKLTAIAFAVIVPFVAVGAAHAADKTVKADKPAKAEKPAKADKAAAGEVTLKGTVGCAKCAFKESSVCQNVLIVKDGDKETRYYIENNEVAKANHGKVCGGTAPATVKGVVKDGKDGKKNLVPSAMTFEG